jgi:hypothetical protein
MDTQDTRKRVTAAVMVTAYRIVAPTCEDEVVRQRPLVKRLQTQLQVLHMSYARAHCGSIPSA